MNIDEIRDLLERYRHGNCTAVERRLVEEWYAALRPGDDEPLADGEVEVSLERVRAGLPWAGEDVVVRRKVLPMGRILVAAALVALVAAVWLLRAPHKAAPAVFADPDVVVSTNRGEVRQIVLPDGTTVELNAGTELRYSRRFGGRGRQVSLIKGEAYFAVVADATQPFEVQTGEVLTKVLGTSFDIRAYGEEGRIRVAVLSGKVAVGNRVLEKGMLARIDSNGTVTARFDSEEEVSAWKNGGLYFKDAGWDQIAFEIANKYNISLVNESRKRQWSYTGVFRSESLQEVIETICQTENLKYKFGNNQVIIIDQ